MLVQGTWDSLTELWLSTATHHHYWYLILPKGCDFCSDFMTLIIYSVVWIDVFFLQFHFFLVLSCPQFYQRNLLYSKVDQGTDQLKNHLIFKARSGSWQVHIMASWVPMKKKRVRAPLSWWCEAFNCVNPFWGSCLWCWLGSLPWKNTAALLKSVLTAEQRGSTALTSAWDGLFGRKVQLCLKKVLLGRRVNVKCPPSLFSSSFLFCWLWPDL